MATVKDARKDGVQRYLCRDCRKSFLESTDSFLSGTHKRLAVWKKYLSCMMERNTLKKSAEKCGLSDEQVCIPCAVNRSGIPISGVGKLGKVSSECISSLFKDRFSPDTVLCTDHEKAIAP